LSICDAVIFKKMRDDGFVVDNKCIDCTKMLCQVCMVAILAIIIMLASLRTIKDEKKCVAVVKYPLGNEAFHATVQRPQAEAPCASSLTGTDSSSEVLVKISVIRVKASIDEDEREREVKQRCECTDGE